MILLTPDGSNEEVEDVYKTDCKSERNSLCLPRVSYDNLRHAQMPSSSDNLLHARLPSTIFTTRSMDESDSRELGAMFQEEGDDLAALVFGTHL